MKIVARWYSSFIIILSVVPIDSSFSNFKERKLVSSSSLHQRERPSIIDGNTFLKVPARKRGSFPDAIERTSHDRRKEGIRMEFRTNQLKINEIHDSNSDRCLEFATYVDRIDHRQTSLREAFEASPSHVNLPFSAVVR